MENSLKVFEYNNNKVRTVEKDGEAWFVAKDVCDVLGIKTEQTRRLDSDEKGLRFIQTPGGEQNMTVISESGLYTLIIRSNKPEAKQFRRWVTHEVLPDIRKHGMYMTDKLRDAAQVDPEAFNAIKNMYLAEKGKVKALKEQIIADAPYTVLGKVVHSLPGTVTVADTAQAFKQRGIKKIGRNILYRFLRDKEFLSVQKKRWNKPTQKGIDSGIVNIELIEPGVYMLSPHAMITSKGLEKIYDELFANEYPLAALWELEGDDEEEEVS